MGVFVLKLAVLVQAILLRLGAAERMSEVLRSIGGAKDIDVLDKAISLVSSADKICGGPEIWTLLTSDPSVTGVQNIKWGKINAVADGYIQHQEVKIKQATHALEILGERIEVARSKAKIAQVSEDQIRAIITAATAPFGGLQDAARTKCGVPMIRPRAPRGSFQKSKEAVEPEARKVFDGTVRMASAPFLEICQEMLPCDAPHGCYCNNLCQGFRDAAQKVSDESSGEHATDVDELLRQEMSLKEELVTRRAEVSTCKDAKEQLDTFGAQIETLKGNVNDRFDDVIKAEVALDDAQWELFDIEDTLKEEEAVLDEASAALEGEQGKYQEAVDALKALRESEASMHTALAEGTAALASAHDQLQDAQNAGTAMNSLKELVSVTMLKMQMFFDQAVQEPLRNLGITEDLDVNKVFADPEGLASVGAMQNAVDTMHTFCSTDGQTAINSMKGKVDLSPLCGFGSTDDIKSSINDAVKESLTTLKDKLEQVKVYLDPYRGQKKMSKTVAQKLVAEGEPAFLREIISAYGSSSFYTNYLDSWKIEGKFQALLKELEEARDVLAKSAVKMTEKTDDIKKQHAEAVAAREAAEEQLQKAAESRQLSEDKRAELLSHVEELREHGRRIGKELAEFEAQVEEARRKHQEALEKLGKSHQDWVASGLGTLWSVDKHAGKEGLARVRMVPEESRTSLLQSLGLASAAIEPLRVEAAKAHDHMVFQKIQADMAERAYREAMSRLSDAKEGQEIVRSLEEKVGASAHRF